MPAKRKTYKTRVPTVENRDPVPEKRAYNPRRYITASMPTTCPDCGHGTRMTGGKHIDPVNQRILEYRDCVDCGARLAASRPMTPREVERYCGHAEAVKQYQETETK